ncbi:MAG TPA: DUF6152 family protein [Gammaproteobacteria bacterium]
MKKLTTAAAAAFALLLAGFPATAHHSGAAYFDLQSTIEHTGATVVSYDLVNPHGRLVYTIIDENGNEVEWSGELASANNLRRRGLGGEIFSPGDQLASVVGNPALSGANFSRLTRVVFANGDVAQLTGPNTGLTRAGSR